MTDKPKSWGIVEIDIAQTVHTVDISDLEFYDEDGKGNRTLIKEIKIKDLTNSEMVMLQSDDLLKSYSGSVSDSGSAKAQVYGMLVTYQRMYKADQNIGFTERHMLKWTTTRSNNLILRIKETLDKVQKKSEPSQNPTPDRT